MNLRSLNHWRWGAGTLIGGIVLLVACDGSNLFDSEQNPFLTPQINLSAPSSAFAGDTMVVSVSAASAVNISSIQVSVRGAAQKDTTITVAPARSVSASVRIGLPTILTDTLIFVAAQATDQNGNVSKVRADTVSVLGPPAIVSVNGPDSLALGATQSISVRAFGSRRISQISFALRGAVTQDTTIFIVPPRNDVTQVLAINVPAVPADTSIRLSVSARDVSGLSSGTATYNVPLKIALPTASFTAPATVSPGSSLDLTVRGQAMRGVARLRVVLAGATSKDTAVSIAPPLPDVSQPISIKIPGNITGDSIIVRAFAIDQAGAVSAPATGATVRVNAGGPVVLSLTAPDSTRPGRTLDVRVVAQGVRPIDSLRVAFRGAVNQTQSIAVSPASTNVTKDVSVSLPVDISDTTLIVTAVAIDQAGALSPLTSSATKTIRVTDVTAPTVTAQASPGATSAGSTIQIRVSARDNVGVSRIGYAVVNPAGDTINGSPTLVNTSGAVKDTTFSFTVPSTLTPRTVRVLGIAADGSGRRGYSTAANVTVADSAAPTITVNAPTPAATLPLNDSVRVQVRVADPTGVKSIVLSGQSVRVDSLGPTLTIQRFVSKTITFPAIPGQPLPRDTTITRYLNAVPDSISEPVSIIVTAKDSLDNTSTSSTSILVGGPRVELRNPINGAQVVPGGTLLLTAFAVDRSAGIDSVSINITGAQTQTYLFKAPCAASTCAPNGLASNDSVVINQNYVVGAALGTMTIQSTAWNRNRIAGSSAIATVTVGSVAVTDTARPQVRVAITANDRIELRDTITLDLAAQDIGQAGLRRMGVVVIATPGGTGVAPDTLYRDSVYAGSGRTGLQPAPFKFTLADFGYTEINLIRMPRTMTFQVHAFAVDSDGNCGANVTNTLATLACDSIMPPLSPSKYFIARNTAGLSQLVSVVPGFARALPTTGSIIADLVVDMNAARPRMYLANQNNNRIDVLNLADSTFANAVSVGSEPWGMFVNNTADRLMVANSGGTNISMVDITQPVNSITEVPAERVLTPNAVLFDVITAVNNGFIRYLSTAHDFSDRPQFVAEDANSIILYSTKPTGAAPDGTVRYLLPTAPRRESKILFNRAAIGPNNDATAIAHVDSIRVQRNSTTDDLLSICDHPAGNPTAPYCSPYLPLRSAINNVILGANGTDDAPTGPGGGDDSDIADFGGAWDLAQVGLSDTTFIAASGDRNFIAFGEGATGPFARVWVWGAAAQGMTDDISVADLVGNSAERVLGVALNQNGLIGGARGAASTYFFSNDANFEGQLRLQGVFSNGVAGGNGGVALHPSHNTALNSNSTTLAFVATVNRSIKIVDTFNFRERGEIQIRDNIVGPLRAALPLAAENAGLAECDEIWVKLYGVTGAGKAVIINVRKKDIINPIITAAACPS